MTMRAGCRFVSLWLISAMAFFSPAFPLYATDTEHREYSVRVDGKDAGLSRITIVQKDDGSTYVTGSVDVKFRHLLSDFTLKVESQEWWKDGRLVGMQTNCVENRKKTDVVVAADNNQLRMRVNGQERVLNPDTWTTSFWKLADSRFHNKQVPVLEVDTGKEFNCELRYLDTQQLKVGKDLQECYHFRVVGGPGQIELWFDRYHRLVRQELAEQGHKTIVNLVNIRR
jgi:hypothetical protein